MEQFTQGPIALWTDCFGNPSDSAVVLLASTAAQAGFWPELFCNSLASKGFFVIRYDYRDVGLSQSCFDHKPYTVEDLAGDVKAILDHYGIEKAHLVGHSMGGYIAQVAASHFPNNILSLTLIATGPIGSHKGIARPSEEEVQQLKKTWEGIARHRPKADFEESWPSYLEFWRLLNGSYPLDEELAKSYTSSLYHRTRSPMRIQHPHMTLMTGLLATLKERNDMMKNLEQPMLIIQGEKDGFMLPSQGGLALAAAMKEHNHPYTLWLVTNMGHTFFNRTLIHELTDKIASFLSEHTMKRL